MSKDVASIICDYAKYSNDRKVPISEFIDNLKIHLTSFNETYLDSVMCKEMLNHLNKQYSSPISFAQHEDMFEANDVGGYDLEILRNQTIIININHAASLGGYHIIETTTTYDDDNGQTKEFIFYNLEYLLCKAMIKSFRGGERYSTSQFRRLFDTDILNIIEKYNITFIVNGVNMMEEHMFTVGVEYH